MNTPLIGSMHLSLPLLLLLGKATLILLAALGITLVMQRASAGARHLVWLVTVGAILLVPAMTAWAPVKVRVLPAEERGTRNEYSVPILPDRAAPERLATARSATPTTVPVLREQASAPASSFLVPRSSFLVPRSSVLLSAWALVALAILASLAWSGLAVRRIVRHASPLEHPSWRTPLYEVADRMGLADAPRLLRSDDAKMPFACGILTPTIVLPADCDAWSMERRRAVLLHELAHVRRHDLLGHTLGRLACAFYWFHPLAWTAAKRLRDESERACDDLALSCGTRATDYAEHLLEIVTSVRKDATPSVALAMARRKEFEGRMLAILDPELRHSTPTRRQSAALIGGLALVALTVSAVSPVARTADAAQAAATHGTPVAPAMGYDAAPGTTRIERHQDSVVHTHAANIVADRAGDAIGRIASATASAAVTAVVQSIAGGAASVTPQEEVSPTTRATRDNARDVRASIAALMGKPVRQGTDDRAALLAKVLATDTSSALRRVAAWGLHEYAGQPVASEALANALRRDADAGVREMAAWALGEGDEHNATAMSALSAALRGDADEKVRATAAWAMGQVGDRSAVEALVAALSSGSAAVRTRALWAIGSVEPKEAPRAVTEKLRDPDARVRRLAAWALFQIEDPASVSALQDALKTEQDKDVQLAEIRAIGAMGDRSVEALKALVESSDPRMRSMAVHALAGGHAAGPWPWPWPEPRPYP